MGGSLWRRGPSGGWGELQHLDWPEGHPRSAELLQEAGGLQREPGIIPDIAAWKLHSGTWYIEPQPQALFIGGAEQEVCCLPAVTLPLLANAQPQEKVGEGEESGQKPTTVHLPTSCDDENVNDDYLYFYFLGQDFYKDNPI